MTAHSYYFQHKPQFARFHLVDCRRRRISNLKTKQGGKLATCVFDISGCKCTCVHACNWHCAWVCARMCNMYLYSAHGWRCAWSKRIMECLYIRDIVTRIVWWNSMRNADMKSNNFEFSTLCQGISQMQKRLGEKQLLLFRIGKYKGHMIPFFHLIIPYDQINC